VSEINATVAFEGEVARCMSKVLLDSPRNQYKKVKEKVKLSL
jgi:hypothetical protein